MSLPLSPITTFLGAAKLAQQTARGISQAVDFDEVLQSASPSEIGSMVAKLTDSIRQRLSKFGVTANPPLTVGLQERGELTIEDDHPQAAEIEAILNADPQLTAAAQRLRSLGGPSQVTVDLTIPDAERNILGSPGGYANWLAD